MLAFGLPGGRFSAAALGLLCLLSAAAAADPVRIRAGWVVTPASLVPILFAKEGLAKHQGITYRFEPVFIGGSPPQITAIAAGELEIATLGFSSFPIAVENAGLTDLRIIADETQDGVHGYFTVHYLVGKDAPITRVEDLKGRIVAVNTHGSAADLGMRTFLAKHGLNLPRDYTLLEVPFATMKAVLADGKADLITATLPFVYDPELAKIGRTLFTAEDAVGGTELSFWCVRGDFLKKNRAALVDLMEDTLSSYRWYADPANHREAIEILAKFTKRPAAALEGWAFTQKDFYRDLDGRPNLQALQKNIDDEKALGFIKDALEVAPYADLSVVAEAANRLK
jgi:sulfonate transport system substrate-binding protein